MQTLETERILLRGWKESDAEDLYAYAKSSLVGPMAGWKPHESLEESRGILREFITSDEVWALELKESGIVVGAIGLHHDAFRAGVEGCKMLGYVLAEEQWGKGLMPEACREALRYVFEEMGLSMMSVHHYSFNGQSRSVIEKLGFTYEGTLRGAHQNPDGTLCDKLCYSMTKEEYESVYKA